MRTIKKLTLFAIVAVVCFTNLSAQKLTPELVIKGGYYKYEYANLFPEKEGKELIDSTVACDLTKDIILRNIITFMSVNGATIESERDWRCIFKIKINVGNQFVSPISVLQNRIVSELTFTVVVDISDSLYHYTISNIQVKEHLLKVNLRYVALAPETDRSLDMTKIATKGSPNYIHRQRITAVIAERNGYVNLVIQERKKVRGLKDKDIVKIKKMDEHIRHEISVCEMEFATFNNFISAMNKSIAQK